MKQVKTAGRLNELATDTLMSHLGIEYLETGYGKLKASMPVDARTCQPFGRLHGGASIALAESAASAGSFALIDEREYAVLGTEVSASHVAAASSGKVFAEASLLHLGKVHHIWEVRIVDESGKLISTCRVTNTLVPLKK